MHPRRGQYSKTPATLYASVCSVQVVNDNVFYLPGASDWYPVQCIFHMHSLKLQIGAHDFSALRGCDI